MSGRIGTVLRRSAVGLALALGLLSLSALACSGSHDGCTVENGGCSAGCILNAGNQCVPAGSGDSGNGSGSQIPNGAHISLDCRPYNIPAYTYSDCFYSHYCGAAGTVPCTMKLADHYGMVIKSATTVGFASEAGAVSPAANSPEYASSKPVDQQETLGHALGFLETCNASLPLDVEPFDDQAHLERRATLDLGCGVRTTNPRDGLVTVIAWVRGEEGYVDSNPNGRYDPGEPFIDLGEPYVDANDSGQWDTGEWFLDVNGNGTCDKPNGVWDADTIIWTQTRVLYTGLPFQKNDNSGTPLFSGLSYSSAVPFTVHPSSLPQVVNAVFTDEHFNPMSAFTTYSGVTATGNLTAQVIGGEGDMDDLGMSFRLRYCPQPVLTEQCEDGPADQGCMGKNPCYVVPEVGRVASNTVGPCEGGACSGFEYATVRQVDIFCTSDKIGSDVVSITATVADVTPADNPLPVEKVSVTLQPLVGVCAP